MGGSAGGRPRGRRSGAGDALALIVGRRLGRTIAERDGEASAEFDSYSRVVDDRDALAAVGLHRAGPYVSAELGTLHDRAQRRLGTTFRRQLRSIGPRTVLDAIPSVVVIAALLWEAATGQATVGNITLAISGLLGIAGFGGFGPLTGLLRDADELLTEVVPQAPQQASWDPGDEVPVGTCERGSPVLTFEDVWFRYAADSAWVLRGVSFELSLGERLGVVGVNGAGKTTLLLLAAGVIQPERGLVLRHARTWLVPQSPGRYPFGATGNASIEHLDEVVSGIRQEFGGIARAPVAALLTLGMSGGQWKQAALSRAKQHADDVLLLDEPVRDLDSEAAASFDADLRAGLGAGAAIVTSHRLSTIRVVDRIVVLSEGLIVEEGNHAQLAVHDGHYGRLYSRQAAGYKTSDDV